jgi:hypothetical protein
MSQKGPLNAVGEAIATEIAMHQIYGKPLDPDVIARAALTALRDNGVTRTMEREYMIAVEAPVSEEGFRAMLDAALNEAT